MTGVRAFLLVLIFMAWAAMAPAMENSSEAVMDKGTLNRLAKEKSPYLLQHATNPVDWYPWGEEAFARARREDKPVFLSVGYSTCHWCHVMARESFENPEIAALLNRWFICIKVDREERPDIDQMYMAATQAMTGGGGWPMSVFLLPDGRPFYAGTYFPAQAAHGLPAFADALTAIHEAWMHKRADLSGLAGQIMEHIAEGNKTGKAGPVDADILGKAVQQFAGEYDQEYGGFGKGQKFPRPVQFNFLFSAWQETGNAQAREMALATLRRMAAGGIRDHLGGGFHRYAVDRQWLVPHFEKMLYDQAQLASSYLDGFLVSRDQTFADVAREIFTYVLRDLTDPGGGFYSAEDADSDDPYSPGGHGEGAYYLWTDQDIERLLPKEDAAIFRHAYNIQAGGNAPADPQGEFKGRNILYLAHSPEETAAKFQRTAAEVTASLTRSRDVLFKARLPRKRPHLDDKVITAWNGMMIGALARGGTVLKDPSLLTAAVRAAGFIRQNLYDAEGHHLMRRYRAGEGGLAAQLDDYGSLTAGLLELYQATQDPQWLRWAVELTSTMISLFSDREDGGFFDAPAEAGLPVRMKTSYDGAEPGGNSLAARNLILLANLTGNREWRGMAQSTLNAFAATINEYPRALPQMLCAWQLMQGKPRQVVIAGPPGRNDTIALLETTSSLYDPGRLVLLADNGANQQYLAGFLPFINDMPMLKDKATAYVCQDFTCQMPTQEVEALRRLLLPNEKKPTSP